MPTPQEVSELIERFDRNREAYLSNEYNEAQVRLELINPFFKALGWDMYNEAGYAEAYKDVVHEDAIKIGGVTKAPDYAFRIGGMRKFFVEAKRPGVSIKNDPDPAYQLRRYAWSAKLPLSILTDFEEFAVYDCRIKPNQADKSSVARVLYFTYKDYESRWDEITAIFSREAILKGSFDKYVESSRKKRGTAEVDDAFLKEIENWRDLLARNIALRNPDLSTRELNYAVQRTIDRIIFLRICEDRGVESYGQLRGLQNGAQVYPRLCQIFRHADERYNSGLFHFSVEKDRTDLPDDLTLGLAIDDKALKEIFKVLYYPESPFEFSVLPADILGHIYEQFLGKVIRLTAGHHAKVEDKPEVKKAGGVYYTPTYIVDYIVKNTVGKLLKGKTPNQVAKLRVLDPACGSGSFLLGAYQYLLDWHQKWYAKHDPEKHAKGRSPKVYLGPGREWRLTTAEKKRILLNNIYGVDIDTQAVEVTKLSLLLKVLEGENAETLGKSIKLFHERALPDLGDNIKCGNSLIGPDFYEGKQLSLLNEEERYRINAFDWNAEFPAIMQAGGFDAVIGNPPYGGLLLPSELNYLRAQFEDQSGSGDTYEFFLLMGSYLLSQRGRISMIIPASWLTGDRYFPSRRILLRNSSPAVAYAMPFDVFQHAYIDTAIVVFTHESNVSRCLIHFFPKREHLHVIPDGIGKHVRISAIKADTLNRFTPIFSDGALAILNKLHKPALTFGGWFKIQRGVQPYSRKKHTEEQIKSRFLHASEKLGNEYLPELQGKELSRYHVADRRESYLRFCDDIASARSIDMFQGKRIVLRRLLTRRFRLQASLAEETLITTDNVLNMVPRCNDARPDFALGILNSRLISWFYVNTSMIAQKDDFPQVHISALRSITIASADKARHNRMVELVEAMLKLHKDLLTAKTNHEKSLIQRQIAATDKQIDQLVYELYDLTEKEIRIVEETTNGETNDLH